MDYSINFSNELYIKNVLNIDKMHILDNYLYIYFIGLNESLNIKLQTQEDAKKAYNMIIQKICDISRSNNSEIENRTDIM